MSPNELVTTNTGAKQSLLERYRQPVDHQIGDVLAAMPGVPARMVEYHVGLRDEDQNSVPRSRTLGKGLRPTLTLLTADATSGIWTPAVPAAAGIEIFHNATLIHDDIQDGDPVRHDRPTVWTIWGEPQAINAGDAAIFASTRSLRGLRNTGYQPGTVLEAEDLLTDASVSVINGQALDMQFETRTDVTLDEYLKMIRGKTGSLIESSVAMGALLGGADSYTTAHLRRFGASLGQAFQIADDRLGIWGNPKITGKSVDGDIKKRKKSYPIIDALGRAEGPARDELVELYSGQTDLGPQQIERVLTILDELGSKERTTAMVNRATDQAIESIEAVDIDHKADYIGLATKFAQREV